MTKHILLVDDDELVGEALKEYLESVGYAVHYATGGTKALELVESRQGENRPFDIGISDVRMPDMDGVTLSRELYRRYKLPMLLISGYPLEQEAMQSNDTGICGLFHKPFALEQLVGKLQSVLTLSNGVA